MKRSWLISAVLLGLIALYPGGPVQAESGKIRAAREAAEAWLPLVDAGKYEESWSQAAALFKEKVGQQAWKEMVGKARGPLGDLQSREFAGARHVTELPGAPDGDYVVIVYSSTFANKKNAKETVTPMLDEDGEWRVSGYYVR